MRPSALRTVGSIAALVLLVFGSVTPVLAGGYASGAYDFWRSNWQTAVLQGDWDGVINTGSPDWRIGQAVQGHYPYHGFGYNNGACIGYELICDQWGNVVGRLPVLVC